MKQREAVPALVGDIEKHLAVLARMEEFQAGYARRHPTALDMDAEAAMAGAQLYCNFYTCMETVFVRISSFFENNLDRQRWHSHLLERMATAIPGERPAVLRAETAMALQEYLRFRHFSRYYFEFTYDPHKLQYLGARFPDTVVALRHDIAGFRSFLAELLQ